MSGEAVGEGLLNLTLQEMLMSLGKGEGAGFLGVLQNRACYQLKNAYSVRRTFIYRKIKFRWRGPSIAPVYFSPAF